jgi:hypothetical protein
MSKLNDILKQEEAKWRNEPYDRLEKLLLDVYLYEVESENKKFTFEIHTKKNEAEEIIVMVECSKKSFFGSFWGKAKYFAKSSKNQIREIEGDEAF